MSDGNRIGQTYNVRILRPFSTISVSLLRKLVLDNAMRTLTFNSLSLDQSI